MIGVTCINDKFSFVYERKVINYVLHHCNRKTMEISVHPNCAVIVKAPINSELTLIKHKLQKRARWIIKQLNYFKQFQPKTPARSYVNGETHLYLGKQYRLKITQGTKNSVKLSRGFFHIICNKQATPELSKKLLQQWYLEKAELVFKESLDHSWKKFSRLNLKKPPISIKHMQKRWGSFSPKGTITLNTNLIKAPKECIDYVVIHELCHFKYPLHNNHFYKLLESILPNWQETKHKLELSLF